MATKSVRSASRAFDSKLKSARLIEVHNQFIGRGVSLPQMVASAAILRAYKIVSQRVDEALAPLDLTMLRYEVLGLLDTSETGRLPFTELKQATLLHSATMTYTIDGLEERKLIRRRREPSDRRAAVAEITPKGRELVRRATEALDAIDFGVTELSDEQAIRAATVLSELHA